MTNLKLPEEGKELYGQICFRIKEKRIKRALDILLIIAMALDVFFLIAWNIDWFNMEDNSKQSESIP